MPKKWMKKDPPIVSVILIVNGKALPPLEMGPMLKSSTYGEDLVAYKSGFLTDQRLSYSVRISGAQCNYKE